jgi:hypothetical protein
MQVLVPNLRILFYSLYAKRLLPLNQGPRGDSLMKKPRVKPPPPSHIPMILTCYPLLLRSYPIPSPPRLYPIFPLFPAYFQEGENWWRARLTSALKLEVAAASLSKDPNGTTQREPEAVVMGPQVSEDTWPEAAEAEGGSEAARTTKGPPSQIVICSVGYIFREIICFS